MFTEITTTFNTKVFIKIECINSFVYLSQSNSWIIILNDKIEYEISDDEFKIHVKPFIENKDKIHSANLTMYRAIDDIDTALDMFKPDLESSFVKYIINKLKIVKIQLEEISEG